MASSWVSESFVKGNKSVYHKSPSLLTQSS